MTPIYLDNNATTAVAPEVVIAMLPYFTEHYGNPSSAHRMGRRAREAVERARAEVAALLRCHAEEIIFTSGGTESNNTALLSALRTTGKKHLVTTQVEHSAVLAVCERLERDGVAVTRLPVGPDGTLEARAVADAITAETALVTLMSANNETGVLFPIAEIAALCRERGVLFHTDAVQAAGKIPIDLRAQPVDFLSLSGHKFHAPKGVGALYVRRGVEFYPFSVGGGHEEGRRGGTENVPAIVGMGRAALLAGEHLHEKQGRTRTLRDRLENGLLTKIPGTHRNGDAARRLSNTANLRFDGVEGEALVLQLSAQGVAASTGSACTTGALAASHVLTAMGLDADTARTAVRFSLSRFTLESEIDKTIEMIVRAVQELRGALPK